MRPPRQLPERLTPDPARVVIRPFHVELGPTGFSSGNESRKRRIVDAVMAMDARTVQAELALVNHDFENRHWQTRKVYLERYEHVRAEMNITAKLREPRKELIGAYFCHEYSYAAAALMNPSVVAHVDQSGLSPGNVRFILSLRAVGEGHISSIAFREGVLKADGNIELMAQPPFAIAADGVSADDVDAPCITAHRNEAVSLTGTVIFPFTRAQRNGIEDLRLLHFRPDEGPPTYYGTYTAYCGVAISSELLHTDDFRTFSLETMSGAAAHNKGMALFPRPIDGAYAMIGRQDNENLFFLKSDDIRRWESGEKIMSPVEPWELVQIGNCGSPMEIDEGWLLLTHGVGAMRQYSIGCALLDKKDPRKVLARLTKPLLSPSDEARAGYVPNVVYTCGGLVNGRTLFLPYGVADTSVAFCNVDIDALLADMS